MKWQVTFRQAQKNCCPPRTYWIVRTQTVEAESAEEAKQRVLHDWRYNHEIVIKEVTQATNTGE